ncbi:hypothetical protein, partial [Sphingorhabdus sp.]|uniref:hypothetical protein n=1 Tax=Sphingorhabdus sp. TaxID=1902408 RepID=UPI003C72C38A
MSESRSRVAACGLAAIIYSILPNAAQSTETTDYQYDALGRLKQSTVAGGPSSGAQTTTAYDPAGNRSNQTVLGVAGGGTPP